MSLVLNEEPNVQLPVNVAPQAEASTSSSDPVPVTTSASPSASASSALLTTTSTSSSDSNVVTPELPPVSTPVTTTSESVSQSPVASSSSSVSVSASQVPVSSSSSSVSVSQDPVASSSASVSASQSLPEPMVTSPATPQATFQRTASDEELKSEKLLEEQLKDMGILVLKKIVLGGIMRYALCTFETYPDEFYIDIDAPVLGRYNAIADSKVKFRGSDNISSHQHKRRIEYCDPSGVCGFVECNSDELCIVDKEGQNVYFYNLDLGNRRNDTVYTLTGKVGNKNKKAPIIMFSDLIKNANYRNDKEQMDNMTNIITAIRKVNTEFLEEEGEEANLNIGNFKEVVNNLQVLSNMLDNRQWRIDAEDAINESSKTVSMIQKLDADVKKQELKELVKSVSDQGSSIFNELKVVSDEVKNQVTVLTNVFNTLNSLYKNRIVQNVEKLNALKSKLTQMKDENNLV